MYYEYPEITVGDNILTVLYEAIKHDPVLYQCYRFYESYCKIEQPFNSINFFKYLSYIALKAHAEKMNTIINYTLSTSQPPTFVYKDGHAPDIRGYWQKLWDSILGR